MSPSLQHIRARLAVGLIAASMGSLAWAGEPARGAGDARDGCSCNCKADDDTVTPAACDKSATGARGGGDRKDGAPAAVSRRPRWHRYLPGMIR